MVSAGLVGIATNSCWFSWQLGSDMPEVPQREYEDCRFRVRYTVSSSVHRYKPSADLLRDHLFFGSTSGDEFCYSRELPGGSSLRLRTTGLVGGKIHLQADPTYDRFVHLRMMDRHSASYILSDLLSWRLLDEGFLPLYCSAFTREATGSAVIMAPSHAGKTVTAHRVRDDFGARILAEDLTIVEGSGTHSVPWTRSEHPSGGPVARTLHLFRGLSHRSRRTPAARTATASGTYDPVPTAAGVSPISDVFFLESHASTEVTQLNVEEGVRRALILNRHSLRYASSPTLLAAAYFSPTIDLDRAMRAERASIESLMPQVEDSWRLRAPHPRDFLDFVPGFSSGPLNPRGVPSPSDLPRPDGSWDQP